MAKVADKSKLMQSFIGPKMQSPVSPWHHAGHYRDYTHDADIVPIL